MDTQPFNGPLSYSRASTFLACRKLYQYRYLEGLSPRVDAPQLTRGKFVDQGLTAAIRAQEAGASATECKDAVTNEIGRIGQEWLASEDVVSFIEMAGPQWRDDAVDLVAQSQLIAIRVCDFLGLGAGKWETLEIPNPDHDPSDPESSPTQLGAQAKVVGRLGLSHTQTFEGACESYGVARKNLDHLRPVDYIGYVDWIAKDLSTGHVWIIDFKVRKVLQDEASVEYDYQLPGYQAALEQMGVEGITGCAHLQVRAAVPKEPDLLKPKATKGAPKGAPKVCPGVSRAQIATDWPTFRDTVKKHGFDPVGYLDMKDKLKPFDQMTRVFRGREELRSVWGELRATSREMDYYHTRKALSRRVDSPRRLHVMQCRGCNFKDLCMAELRGHDSEHVKQTQYKQKSKQNDTEKPTQAIPDSHSAGGPQ